MKTLIPLIFGMAVVTYLPRLIPLLFIGDRKIPERMNAFLKCIPLAALGALVVPGAFQATPDLPLAAAAGMGFTIAYGLIRGGIIVPVLGAVAVTYCVLWVDI